jgi:hypothetical protein
MKTKKFYTVAELANLFHIAHTNFAACYEAHKKFPDDEIIAYNFQQAKKTLVELDSLIEKLDVLGIVLDYYGGIDRTTGNNKIYTK